MMPIRCGPIVPSPAFAAIRRRLVLDYCKWDPQVEDVAALCPAPLVLSVESWEQLSRWSEQLYGETLAAEQEILDRPELIGRLGLPRKIAKVLTSRARLARTPSLARVMRFDFHWTLDGWRISEVNSDVPGGFIEASVFTQMMADATGTGTPTADPAAIYADRVACSTPGPVGLVHATAYSDDRQVMSFLAGLLQARGRDAYLVSPADIDWQGSVPTLITPAGRIPASGLVRFFPGEWLPELGRRSGWEQFYRGSRIPVSNPGWALATQSKRWPLVWKDLQTPIDVWRALLPETCDPRSVDWKHDPQWVLKPTWGRIGDSIGIRGVVSEKEWSAIARSARWWPTAWVAQRKFVSQAVETHAGTVHPVIGVYVVDGLVAGVYGRIGRRALIDHLAQDVAVLISQSDPQPDPQPDPQRRSARGGLPREVASR